MQATVEISLYPLDQEYEQIVIDFILKLRLNLALRVETNGMSTQIFGDYKTIMDSLTNEMEEVLKHTQAIFVLKLGKQELSSENLPEILK